MAYSVDANGRLLQTYHNKTTTFTGLPAAVAAGMGDFGKDSGGVALLSDGSMVLTLDVRWGYDRGAGPDTARLDDLTVATSVVAFRSLDNGSSWEYTATLCNASNHRGCGECCNENHVVTLADGHTVMAVYRMGAGDGTQFNKSLGINGSCVLPTSFLPAQHRFAVWSHSALAHSATGMWNMFLISRQIIFTTTHSAPTGASPSLPNDQFLEQAVQCLSCFHSDGTCRWC